MNKQNIPIEIEITKPLKAWGTLIAKRGDRFVAMPNYSDKRHRLSIGAPTWNVTINGKEYMLFFQLKANKKDGRFRFFEYRSAYAKIAKQSEMNKIAEMLYCF